MDTHETENFCKEKKTIIQKKMQFTEWEKIVTESQTDRGHIPKI